MRVGWACPHNRSWVNEFRKIPTRRHKHIYPSHPLILRILIPLGVFELLGFKIDNLRIRQFVKKSGTARWSPYKFMRAVPHRKRGKIPLKPPVKTLPFVDYTAFRIKIQKNRVVAYFLSASSNSPLQPDCY